MLSVKGIFPRGLIDDKSAKLRVQTSCHTLFFHWVSCQLNFLKASLIFFSIIRIFRRNFNKISMKTDLLMHLQLPNGSGNQHFSPIRAHAKYPNFIA